MALSLKDFHREQIAKYIKFFKAKRELQVSEIQELFQDAIETRLDSGALMSPEEVSDLLQSLKDSVKMEFEEDLKRTVNMSVLAIQQLLEDADAQDIELQMDTSKIEDSHLLAEVESIRVEGNVESRKSAGRLVSLRDEQQRIIDQNQRLESELAKLRKENESLRDECDTSKQKISNFTYEVESLKRQLDAIRSNQSESKSEQEKHLTCTSDVISLQEELDEERDRISTLRAELEDAKAVLQEKYGLDFDEICRNFKNSKQFAQLRKTLGQKTDQLTDLRRRIVEYEPDVTQIERDYDNKPLRHK